MRWWPAILLGDVGSLLGDVLSLAVPVGSALAQAVGDMTGLLVAAIILRRLVGPRAAMDRLSQVGAVLVAVAAGAAISASVAMVAVGGGRPHHRGRRSSRSGGAGGSVTLPAHWLSLPLALAWARPCSRAWRNRGSVEAALMIAAVIALSVIAVSTDDPFTYLVFPAFIWAALRFGAQGATLAVAVAVVIAAGRVE